MKVASITFVLSLITSLPLFAHDGHAIPGSLPPAPHGGNVQEASHKEKGHAHEGADEVELFFEAVYKDKILKVFALGLPAKDPSSFTSLSPKTELTNIQIKVENPRTKKMETINPQVGDDAVTAKFDMKGANRFIVHVSADHKKETKAAKIQLEVNG